MRGLKNEEEEKSKKCWDGKNEYRQARRLECGTREIFAREARCLRAAFEMHLCTVPQNSTTKTAV